MKKFTLLSMLLMTVASWAAPGKETHADISEEIKCYKEVHALGCGPGLDHQSFFACVDRRQDHLAPDCREFHRQEKDRVLGN